MQKPVEKPEPSKRSENRQPDSRRDSSFPTKRDSLSVRRQEQPKPKQQLKPSEKRQSVDTSRDVVPNSVRKNAPAPPTVEKKRSEEAKPAPQSPEASPPPKTELNKAGREIVGNNFQHSPTPSQSPSKNEVVAGKSDEKPKIKLEKVAG